MRGVSANRLPSVRTYPSACSVSRKRRAAARVSPVAAGHLGQRELRFLGPEGPDHRQAALQRLDEVSPHSASVLFAIATALLAAGTPA